MVDRAPAVHSLSYSDDEGGDRPNDHLEFTDGPGDHGGSDDFDQDIDDYLGGMMDDVPDGYEAGEDGGGGGGGGGIRLTPRTGAGGRPSPSRSGKRKRGQSEGGAGGAARGEKRSRKGNNNPAADEDWVPIQVPSVVQMRKMFTRETCHPQHCYLCRHVGYRLPQVTRADAQKLVHTIDGMIEGADPVLVAQDAARVYARLRERTERYRLPTEDSLPEMTAMDILVHMRGNMRNTVTDAEGNEQPASVLPHNRTPENMMGLIRDMIAEKILLHYKQGSMDRVSADYTTPEGDPYLMLDKDQVKIWLDLVKAYREAAKDDPQRMHGFVPASDRVVTNKPQGTLNVENKRIVGLSAIETERNQLIIESTRTSFENSVMKHRRMLKQ